jgi:hypothetical protein
MTPFPLAPRANERWWRAHSEAVVLICPLARAVAVPVFGELLGPNLRSLSASLHHGASLGRRVAHANVALVEVLADLGVVNLGPVRADRAAVVVVALRKVAVVWGRTVAGLLEVPEERVVDLECEEAKDV